MKRGLGVAALNSASLVFVCGWLYSCTGVRAAFAAQVAGTIKFDGTVPRQRPIDMAKEPSCDEAHVGKPATTENVIVGANGGLANVVVYISQGLTGKESISAQPAQMTQKGCQYLPHVLAVNPGQHLKILNNDQAWHNIHPESAKNPVWNKSQAPGASALDVSWSNPEVIPVKCQLHPWMHAYVVVVPGPYGVSSDSGSFKLDNVPPGTYTLTAWHETYGTQTQTIKVLAGKPASVSFTFKAK